MTPDVPPSPDVGAPAPGAAAPTRASTEAMERPARAGASRRPWGRRLLLLVGAAALVVIALRVIAWVAIPIVLDRVAGALGLHLETRDVSLSLLGGEVELVEVRASARDGGERVLDADYLRADLALLPLLRGDLVLARVELDGVDVLLDRGLRDRVELMDQLDRALRPVLGPEPAPSGAAHEAEDTAEDDAEEEKRGRRRLDLPVEVRRLVVRHLRVRLVDPFVAPPVDVTADVTIELAGLELDRAQPTRVALTIEAPGVIERLSARGLARLGRDRLEADVRLEAVGLRPGPVQGWLDALDVRCAHRSMALEADATFMLRPALQEVEDLAASITLDRLEVLGDEVRVLGAERVHVELEGLYGPGVDVRRLEASGVRGSLTRDGRALEVSGVRFTLPGDEDEEDDDEQGPVVLRDVLVRDLQAVYRDAGVPGGLTVPVHLSELRLRGADSRTPEQPGRIALHLASPGVARSLSLRGDLWLFASRLGLEAQLEGRGLTLEGLRPALEAAGLAPSLTNGELSAGLRLFYEERQAPADAPRGGERGDAAAWPIAITAHVNDLRLTDGQVELLALDLLDAPALQVDPRAGRARAEGVTVRGPRAALRRDAGGRLHVGGLALIGGAPSSSPLPASPAPGDAQTGDEAPGLRRWRLQVPRLDLQGVAVTWLDEAPPDPALGPVRLSVADAGLLVEGLDLDLGEGATPSGPPARLHVWVEAPGVVERLELDGTAQAARGRLSVELGLEGRGLTLGGLRPYLDAVGLEPTFERGHLSADLEAAAALSREGLLTAEGALVRARLSDAGRTLLAVADLRGEGLTAQVGAAAPTTLGARRLSLRRLELPVRLSPDGAVTALGFRFGRDAAPDVAAPDEPWAVRFKAPLVPLPRLKVGGVDIERATLRIQDERRADPEDALPVELDLSLGAFDFEPDEPVHAAATPFAARLEAPGAVDVLRLAGAVTVAPDLVRLEALLTAHGLTQRFVSSIPGLHTQDMVIDEGHATLRASATLYREGDLLAGRGELRDAALTDRTGELLGLDLARVSGFTIGPVGVRVTDLDVRAPRVRALRTPGGLRLGGLWLEVGADGAGVTAPSGDAGGPWLPDLPPVHLDQARITALEVDWTDLATTPLVRQQLTVDLVAHDLSTIAGQPPGVVRLVARAPGAVDRLVLGGRVRTDRRAASAALALDARGIRGAGLAAYAPGLDLALGRAQGTLELQVHELDQGGLAARLEVRDALLRDGQRVLAHAPLLVVDAPRLAPARRLDVARVHVEVETLELGRRGDVLHVAGVPLGAQPGAPPARAAAPTPPVDPAAIGAPPVGVVRPLLRVGLIDLLVQRLRLVDRTDGRTVAVGHDLRLRSLEPFALLGPPGRRQRRGPSFELTGAVAPLVEALRVRITGDPFALDPELELEVEAAGLRGVGLTEVAPALAGRLDGSALTDGHLQLTARLSLRTRRSDPLDVGFLQRGFGARLEVAGLDLRANGARGQQLLAADQLLVDVDHFVPGEQELEARVIELFRPHAVVTRLPEGWRVAGLVFKPGPEAEEDEQPEDAVRVMIRKLSIMSLEVTFRDHTVSPNLIVPVRGLELEVSGLDTAALRGQAPARAPLIFSLLAFSRPVPLPRRPERGLERLRGIWSSILELFGGGRDRDAGVERLPLFDELSARGVVEPGPDPTGRVRLSVRTFELRALIGLAAASGVTLSDGVLDLDVVVDLGPAGEADAQVGAVVQDLSLTEPRGGPIQRLLRLPATLDVLLFVLRDDRGRIRLSIDAEVPPDGQLERGEVAGAVIEALGEQSARALRSAPLRVLSPIVALLNLFVPGDIMDWREWRVGEPLAVTFAPGSVALDPPARAALGRLARRLQDHGRLSLLVRHELGSRDQLALDVITRPGPEHDQALVTRLQRRRAELRWERADLEARARAAFVAGQHPAAQTAIAAAQRVEARLGTLEAALFAAEDRLGSHIDRLAERRARTAAGALSLTRLRVVREALCQAGVRDAQRRVRLGPGQHFAAPGTLDGTVVATPWLRLVQSEEVSDSREEGEEPEADGP